MSQLTGRLRGRASGVGVGFGFRTFVVKLGSQEIDNVKTHWQDYKQHKPFPTGD